MEDTIVAIGTAHGVGGVAIIRLSGNPLGIAEKMFKPTGKTQVKDFEPYKLYTGEIDCGGFKDFGMCVYFKAPKSYTGEDMIEFHSHGGTAIAEGVVNKALSLGARLAERGEYTKRAFVNGKLSLSSAEGLIDMINSESEGEVKAGYYLYREQLKEKIDGFQSKLTYALAQIEANIDFPEEDLEETAINEVLSTLTEVKTGVSDLLKTFSRGSKIKNGVLVSIVGRPNTGKSSLLNRFVGYDKAIVSNIAGTTRDIVEGTSIINGVRFNFKDTAGIRDSQDAIEKVGISLSLKAIKESDIVLAVFDATDTLNSEDKELLETIDGERKIIVINKIDGKSKIDLAGDISVSALTGENFDKLEQMLYERTVGVSHDKDFLTEKRHYEALKRALTHLDNAAYSVQTAPLDLSSIDIRSAWSALGEISGKTASEEIISEIFAKFCVGK